MEALEFAERPGDGGVLRISIKSGDQEIGDARIMGHTLGDIEIKESLRGLGVGTRVIRELTTRYGLLNANVVTAASRKAFAKAGWTVSGAKAFRPQPRG